MLRRAVLADKKVGEEGRTALAAALALNTTFQVHKRFPRNTPSKRCMQFMWCVGDLMGVCPLPAASLLI